MLVLNQIKYNLLKRNNIKFLGRVNIRNKNVSFGKNVILYDNVHFLGQGKVEIGDNVAIGNNTIIFCAESIIIEKNTLIAANNYIIDADHKFECGKSILEQGLEVRPILISEDTWLGAGVTVLKGVKIAKGSVVGAGSVVTKSLSYENGIYFGIPAKFNRYR